MSKEKLTFICPVYNEQEVIKEFYSELEIEVKSLHSLYDVKILFVVDKCSDNTFEILSEIAKNNDFVSIILLSKRFGHQMSLIAGIDHAPNSIIIMMDSDLQHPVKIIKKLINKYKEGSDIVFTVRKNNVGQGYFRNLFSKIFYKLLNTISDIEISAGEADFRLISPKVAEIFRTQIRERNQFLRGLFRWVGFKSSQVTFIAGPRKKGRTKYSLPRVINFAILGFISFSRAPLKYAIYLGLALSFIGFGIGLHSFISYFLNQEAPSGWTTLTVIISIFSGVQLLFLGIIGEYIGAIFDEVKSRPLYLIQQKVNLPEK